MTPLLTHNHIGTTSILLKPFMKLNNYSMTDYWRETTMNIIDCQEYPYLIWKTK